jgi:hypothetical protein
MVTQDRVKQQLKSIDADFQFVGRAELRELPKILFDDEYLQHVVFGRYAAGFALLCATNQRVLLIDKKPLYLTLEDIRYDMISDMVFNHRLIDTSVTLGTVHKSITFISYNQHRLREMTSYVQKRVMDSRRQQSSMPSEQPMSGLLGEYETVEPHASDIAVSSHPAMMSPYRNPIVIRRRASKFFPSLY